MMMRSFFFLSSRWRAFALVICATSLGFTACKKEPSRWDKAAESPPPPPATATVAEKAGGAFNKLFPADGVDGYKRVFTQEKDGYAEAKLQKDGKDVATAAASDIANDAAAKGKFARSTDNVAGHPLVTVGKNQSALLIKERYQIKISSSTLDAEARKQLLAKFDLAGFAAL
jgi:hypothetical protein